MSIHPYLNFDGNCREAVTFYAEVFGIENPQIMTFGEGPQDPNFNMPEEAKNRVLHAKLPIGSSELMFSDTFPGSPFVQGNNVTLAYVSNDEEAIRSIFHKLADGGAVEMPLQQTFWSPCYGYLTDRYGIGWQLSCDK